MLSSSVILSSEEELIFPSIYWSAAVDGFFSLLLVSNAVALYNLDDIVSPCSSSLVNYSSSNYNESCQENIKLLTSFILALVSASFSFIFKYSMLSTI